jgi:hypothetical protein
MVCVEKNISVKYYCLFERIRAFLDSGVYAPQNTWTQHPWIRVLESTQQKRCLLGRGLADDPLSLSNETRCRGGVSLSTALSDTL